MRRDTFGYSGTDGIDAFDDHPLKLRLFREWDRQSERGGQSGPPPNHSLVKDEQGYHVLCPSCGEDVYEMDSRVRGPMCLRKHDPHYYMYNDCRHTVCRICAVKGLTCRMHGCDFTQGAGDQSPVKVRMVIRPYDIEIELQVGHNASLSVIRQAIIDQAQGLLPDNSHARDIVSISCGGLVLHDGDTLEDLGIEEDARMDAVVDREKFLGMPHNQPNPSKYYYTRASLPRDPIFLVHNRRSDVPPEWATKNCLQFGEVGEVEALKNAQFSHLQEGKGNCCQFGCSIM